MLSVRKRLLPIPQGRAAGTIRVNVIGGHSGKTILPVMSQVGGFEFTDEEAAQLVRHIQDAGNPQKSLKPKRAMVQQHWPWLPQHIVLSMRWFVV